LSNTGEVFANVQMFL